MDKIAAVLAELREEQARLAGELARIGRVIEVLTEAMEAPAMMIPIAPPPPPPARIGYEKMTLYEATAAYLATVDEPQTSRQIADALRAGGFKTRSSNFAGTVRTMLRRHPTKGIRATSDGSRWVGTAKQRVRNKATQVRSGAPQP